MAMTCLLTDFNIYKEHRLLIQIVAYLISIIVTTNYRYHYHTTIANTGGPPTGSFPQLCRIMSMRLTNAISMGVIVGTWLIVLFP